MAFDLLRTSTEGLNGSIELAGPVRVGEGISGTIRVRTTRAIKARSAGLRLVGVRIAEARALDKGAEIDVACAARRGSTLVWEGVTTFYYRGRRGTVPGSPPPPSPAAEGPAVAQWTPEAGARLRFARLTGDYNPMHWSDAYARRAGFRCAFHHAQRMLGQCLARLPRRAGSLLQAWFKGPVYYGAQVTLRDEWEWLKTGWDAADSVRAQKRLEIRAGLTPERERAILAAMARNGD